MLMATATSYHQRYRPGQGTNMDKCNTWPPHPEGLPMTTTEGPSPALHHTNTNTNVNANNSNVPFAPILFQGESVMALPAQWVFSHIPSSRVEQFVTADDILRSSFQAHPPPQPPLFMFPTSTVSMRLGSTATTSAGGNGSPLVLDPLTEYQNGTTRLEAQGRATDMSLDIAMAMQDQGPMYFVLSRFQPPGVTHITTVPLPPQPTEEHLQVLMVPDMFNIELPRDDSISMGDYHHNSGMTTISPADTMNSPLHSALTPAMAAMSATSMVGSPYFPTKEETIKDDNDEYDNYEHSDDTDNDIGNDHDIDDNMEDEDCKDERASSVDTSIKTENEDNDARLKSKCHECSTCHKVFTRRSNLKTHERLHTRTHAVACEICKCTFSRQPDLNRHLLAIHQGARTHGCEKCGRSFSRKDAWRVHQSSCKRSTSQLE